MFKFHPIHSTMASRIASRYLTSIIQTPKTISSSFLRPYPRLPRTLQPALRRSSHTIPKPPASLPPTQQPNQKRIEPHYRLSFTCVPCAERSTHTISKQGYHKGSVLITCPNCRNRHVISDHLGIFGDRKLTVEDILREKGQLVKRGTLGEDGDVEFWQDETTDTTDARPTTSPQPSHPPIGSATRPSLPNNTTNSETTPASRRQFSTHPILQQRLTGAQKVKLKERSKRPEAKEDTRVTIAALRAKMKQGDPLYSNLLTPENTIGKVSVRPHPNRLDEAVLRRRLAAEFASGRGPVRRGPRAPPLYFNNPSDPPPTPNISGNPWSGKKRPEIASDNPFDPPPMPNISGNSWSRKEELDRSRVTKPRPLTPPLDLPKALLSKKSRLFSFGQDSSILRAAPSVDFKTRPNPAATYEALSQMQDIPETSTHWTITPSSRDESMLELPGAARMRAAAAAFKRANVPESYPSSYQDSPLFGSTPREPIPIKKRKENPSEKWGKDEEGKPRRNFAARGDSLVRSFLSTAPDRFSIQGIRRTYFREESSASDPSQKKPKQLVKIRRVEKTVSGLDRAIHLRQLRHQSVYNAPGTQPTFVPPPELTELVNQGLKKGIGTLKGVRQVQVRALPGRIRTRSQARAMGAVHDRYTYYTKPSRIKMAFKVPEKLLSKTPAYDRSSF
ncbi:hypothetical protein F5Y16DRAFT_365432 [Xylariaceae sp. FL0255]|nr:hypothetical protein F5Y16DRAFT_365432 [Xylariaceae sp. FL0255]